DTITIVYADDQPADGSLPTTYAGLAGDVRAGDTILIDDGLVRLRVEGVDEARVRCRVEIGGTIKDRKGINLPGVAVSAPALTEKDLEDLAFGAELGVDFLCLSFVRSPRDIDQARRALADHGAPVPII